MENLALIIGALMTNFPDLDLSCVKGVIPGMTSTSSTSAHISGSFTNENRMEFTLLISERELSSGEIPPCTQRNRRSRTAERGRARNDSIQAM